jgi:DNA-binding NarL/FixJ family response regulator
MSKPRILLADDHRIVAEGLRSLLEPEFELIGIVEDGRALLEAAEKLRPDVIVVDISMPLLNGIEAVRQIRKSNRDVKVVFLTMHPDVTYAVSAMEAGAMGYVLKHSAPAELTRAVRAALSGRTFVTPLLAGEIMENPGKGSRERREESSHLTRRQREVLQLLAEGYLAKEIAAMLNISTRTVEYHKYQMMKDTGLQTVADLIRYAVKHNIVSE